MAERSPDSPPPYYALDDVEEQIAPIPSENQLSSRWIENLPSPQSVANKRVRFADVPHDLPVLQITEPLNIEVRLVSELPADGLLLHQAGQTRKYMYATSVNRAVT